MNEEKNTQQDDVQGGEPFYPHELLRFGVAFFVFLAVLLAIAIFLPKGTHTPADPMNTPAHIKPEWYFLAAYQMLKVIPNEIAGLTLQGLAGLAIVLVPFWEKSKRRHPAKRFIFSTVTIAVIGMFVALTLWGHYS